MLLADYLIYQTILLAYVNKHTVNKLGDSQHGLLLNQSILN